MKKVKAYPPFSVLMSVYKNESADYLNQSLRSIVNQTVPPYEIILVEDGPLPRALEKVIIKFQDRYSRFRVIKIAKNKGLGNALRIGTKYVNTEWIARMDSDDISVENRFELQLKAVIQDPSLAVVGGQVSEFMKDDSNIVGYRYVPIDKEEIYSFAKWRSPFNHPSVLINKNKLEAVGGYCPYGNLEDYYLWVRMIAKEYNVKNLDRVLVKMRVDSGMYSRRGKFSNIRYFYQLRNYLLRKGLVTRREELIGDILMTVNIIVPGSIRKLVYKKILHSKTNS